MSPRLCGERPFATIWAAKMALRRIDPSTRTHRRDVRIWNCSSCNAWHADGVPRTREAG